MKINSPFDLGGGDYIKKKPNMLFNYYQVI